MTARRPSKLVLVVIDGMTPRELERAVAQGQAPTLEAIIDRGHQAKCVAPFPSLTPVCSATIMTGFGPDVHHVPSMNWYSRQEGRYVEYGTSFRASQTFGLRRSLMDTIYKLNLEHLSARVKTVFEQLDDENIRTAGTTYLVYRGRHLHQLTRRRPLDRLAAAFFRESTFGPREFYYADLFASRPTPCRSQMGLPGFRDQHSACVGEYLVENDLFDFFLLSLPDTDTQSHRTGLSGQVAAIAGADKHLCRVVDAAGGLDEFLSQYAVIICSDHSHSDITSEIDLFAALSEYSILPATARGDVGDSAIAVCPGSRSAQVYLLDSERRSSVLRSLVRRCRSLEGVDFIVQHTGSGGREALVENAEAQLRFSPGGEIRDELGNEWQIDGDYELLDLEVNNGVVTSNSYPYGLARLWEALTASTTGDVLLSAKPGFEFVDWGGGKHTGGSSHGSLHTVDSYCALIWAGLDEREQSARAPRTLADITPMICRHFGVCQPAP